MNLSFLIYIRFYVDINLNNKFKKKCRYKYKKTAFDRLWKLVLNYYNQNTKMWYGSQAFQDLKSLNKIVLKMIWKRY